MDAEYDEDCKDIKLSTAIDEDKLSHCLCGYCVPSCGDLQDDLAIV